MGNSTAFSPSSQYFLLQYNPLSCPISQLFHFLIFHILTPIFLSCVNSFCHSSKNNLLCFNIIPVIVDSFKIINSKLTILFADFLRNLGYKLCSSVELSTLSSGNSDAVILILTQSLHSSLCLSLVQPHSVENPIFHYCFIYRVKKLISKVL